MATLGLVLHLAFAGLASAQEAAPDQALAEIREMVLYARYREALDGIAAYLQRTDLGAAQRNAGLELLATVHIAMRDQAAATTVLQQLYARDPGHRLSDPEASPPVLSAFGRARSNPPPRVQVELQHEPPRLDQRRPPLVEVRLGAGADAVAEVRLRYRQGDDTGYTTVVLRSGSEGVMSARLPVLDRSEAYDVQYVLEALAPSGEALATRGSEAEPLSFTMPAAAATPVAVDTADDARPVAGGGGDDLIWLWTTLGVVAVAAGVTIAVVVAMDGPQGGSLDTIQLPLVRF
jgi:hypothetical protein